MKFLIIAAVAIALIMLWLQSHSRNGGELRLKHIVTVATPVGEKSFSSVVSMIGRQSYNYNAGGSGWGGIGCKLTGGAVRATVGDTDFFFLLAEPAGYTPAWTQIDLIKKHFGLANRLNDAGWVKEWKALARSTRTVVLEPGDYPAIAAMPHDGWMNDAKLVSPAEAGERGLRIVRYQLQITDEPVGAGDAFEVRYRPTERGGPQIEFGRQFFTVKDGPA